MIFLDWPITIVAAFLFVVGACVGSFLNVCAYRLPLRDGVWTPWWGVSYPPSACGSCDRPILPRDNIPILAWIFLGGLCRFCRAPYSIRYPIVEFANGLLWALTYVLLVPCTWGATLAQSCLATPYLPALENHWGASHYVHIHVMFVCYLLLFEGLVVASLIDFDLKILPDCITAPTALVGWIVAIGWGPVVLVPLWTYHPETQDLLYSLATWAFPEPGSTKLVPTWIAQAGWLHAIAASTAGAVMGGGIVWGVRLIGGWILRREAMGFGDVILMAAMGGFVGWQAILIVFFMAPMLALIVVIVGVILGQGRWVREIPYGPYLSLATVVTVLGWTWIWPQAERFFAMGPLLAPLALFLTVAFALALLLVQVVKRVLGIVDDEEGSTDWTSADQLTFYANKHAQQPVHPQQVAVWPGASSGRGTLHLERWSKK